MTTSTYSPLASVLVNTNIMVKSTSAISSTVNMMLPSKLLELAILKASISFFLNVDEQTFPKDFSITSDKLAILPFIQPLYSSFWPTIG